MVPQRRNGKQIGHFVVRCALCVVALRNAIAFGSWLGFVCRVSFALITMRLSVLYCTVQWTDSPLCLVGQYLAIVSEHHLRFTDHSKKCLVSNTTPAFFTHHRSQTLSTSPTTRQRPRFRLDQHPVCAGTPTTTTSADALLTPKPRIHVQGWSRMDVVATLSRSCAELSCRIVKRILVQGNRTSLRKFSMVRLERRTGLLGSGPLIWDRTKRGRQMCSG